MELEKLPVIGWILAAGADDHVFDALLTLGPIIIVAIAILGRTPIAVAIAIVYTVGFFGYVLYNGLHDGY